MSIMDERWYGIIQKFYKQNYGFTSQKNRTQLCSSLVYPAFYHLIDHLYVVRKPLNGKVQQVSFECKEHEMVRPILKNIS